MPCKLLHLPSMENFAANTSCSSLRNQENSPFFRLPPEIRNAIYVLVLSHHLTCRCNGFPYAEGCVMSTVYECSHDSMYTLTSITRTCRQIHAESALVFLEINLFGAHEHKPSLRYWVLRDKCTEQQRQSIKHWWISADYIFNIKGISEPFDLLPGLQTVTVTPWKYSGNTRPVEAGGEARVRSMIWRAAGRELHVLFEYKSYL